MQPRVAPSSRLSRFATLLLVAACSGAAACGSNSGDEDRLGEVLSTLSCAGVRCESPTEIRERIGFLPVEPRALPDRFRLYERYVLVEELSESGEDEARLAGTPAAPLQAVTVVLDYRFEELYTVPAVHVIETRALPGRVSVRLAGPECGEVVEIPEGRVLYGKGLGTAIVDDNEADYEVCPADGPPGTEIHSAFAAKRDILIEVKAFPDARVSREDVVELVASILRQVR